MSVVFAAIGVAMAVGGYALKLRGQYGPGTGFTAFWVGLCLAILSIAWCVQLVRSAPHADEPFMSEPGGVSRLLAVVVALVLFAVALTPLGFNLAMLALLLFLFFGADRTHAVAKMVIALLASFGVHYVFEHYLRVPLPYASIELLQRFGM